MIADDLILQLAGVRGLEWVIIIGLIVVVFFGVKKIPELARSFGKATGEYEKARLEARREVEQLKNSLSSNGSSISSSNREKLEEIANTLKIDIGNKTDDQLRMDIQKELGQV